MGLDETFSKGPNPISHDLTTKRFGVGRALVARRKLFIHSCLYRRIQPISVPLEPLNRAAEPHSRVSFSITVSHVPAMRICYRNGNRNAMDHASGGLALGAEAKSRTFPTFSTYKMR